MIKDYNFNYTIVDVHGVFMADPPARHGCFYPMKTPGGVFLLARDYPGCRAMRMPDAVADTFLAYITKRLNKAGRLMDLPPVSLCVVTANSDWLEWPLFLEHLFRQNFKNNNLQFLTPEEYLCKQKAITFQTLIPEYSSAGTNGYGDDWLDSGANWVYRHLLCSQERMIEMAGRFNDSGLCSRALNQAAREVLLAQCADWSKMAKENSEYAKERLEFHLRNFNTIYEYLGSNYVSTKYLTWLEQIDNIFPDINYRSFRRKS
jgi:1,4-alpha-glucan branching enzyme